MSDFTLEGYRGQLKNIARPYLFYAIIPIMNKEVKIIKFLVRSTSVPSRTISNIDTNWQGYTYHWAGVSTWEDWSCTFLLDDMMDGYKNFIEWMKTIHDPDTNIHGYPDTYEDKENMILQQLNQYTGDVMYQWKLHHAWPQVTAGYEMNYGSTDSPAEFQVTFKYTHATLIG